VLSLSNNYAKGILRKREESTLSMLMHLA